MILEFIQDPLLPALLHFSLTVTSMRESIGKLA